MKYSPSARGFFHESSKNLPWDAVEISDQEYTALIQGQNSGLMISEELGKPVLIPRPALTWADLRVERNAKLSESDWTQLPDKSLPSKWDWAVYRQQLSDLPQTYPDPASVVWPTPP